MSDGRFVSYAQNLEDVLLWRALGAVEAGFYVDVGASDATRLSVTRAFYERGWRGVNVEPLPEAAAALLEARPGDVTVQAAVGDASAEARFYRVTVEGQTGLSTLDAAEAAQGAATGAAVEAIDVPVRTLASICAEHVRGPVHFLKIDVEGAEAAVLRGADFSAVRPWIVLVEATAPMSGVSSEAAWEPDLLSAGYRFVWFDGLNRFYVAEEHAGLARHFTVPPNVFDHYVPFHPGLEATAALAESRKAEIERLERELARVNAVAVARLEALEKPVSPEPGPEPDPVRVGEAPAPLPEKPPRRGVARGLVMALYAPFRPVLRPMVWRMRTFMQGNIMAQQAQIVAMLAEVRARQDATPPPGPAVATLDERTLQSIERLLLTLALEHGALEHGARGHGALEDGRRGASPGLSNDRAGL